MLRLAILKIELLTKVRQCSEMLTLKPKFTLIKKFYLNQLILCIINKNCIKITSDEI